MKRLGKSAMEVSNLGMGCWAIGGLFTLDGLADGWGQVDDQESIRAIQRAFELGITFFDTADVYGTGHSERILGEALKGMREQAVIATKFGYTYNEDKREVLTDYNVSPAYIRQACEESMRRLQTDYIDLYQIHVGSLRDHEVDSAIESLDRLKREGYIRAYGWSTSDVKGAEQFAKGSHADTLQFSLNVLKDRKELIDLCERHQLSAVINSPLAMGLLSGKFNAASRLPADDVRGSSHSWVTYFQDGKPREDFLQKLEAIKEILTSNGRTLVQGALGWIWGRSETTIPIPGIKTVSQAEEIAKAMHYGPLNHQEMMEIKRILDQF